MYQGAKKGYGADEALGFRRKLLTSWQSRVCSTTLIALFSKNKSIGQNGLSGLRLFDEALIVQPRQALDFTARIFNAGVGEVARRFSAKP